MKALVPTEVIELKILLINGQKVLLDHDLAALYGVTTKANSKKQDLSLQEPRRCLRFSLQPVPFSVLLQ
jgi:hypothetical protein